MQTKFVKILILDPERKTSHRIAKDTSGGYGTGNNFGDTILPTLIKKLLKHQRQSQQKQLD